MTFVKAVPVPNPNNFTIVDGYPRLVIEVDYNHSLYKVDMST